MLKTFGIIVWCNFMSKKIRDTKIRTLIKAYLVFHRGKRCTAKEISEWINCNQFNLNHCLVNANIISRLIYAGKYVPSHILYDVESSVRSDNRKEYGVN